MTERTVTTNGVDLHVVDEGPADGPVVVLAHGFPELAYSWRHQIPALAGAGYRVLAPDQRGYGRSDRPVPIGDYDIVHLTDDLLGLLDDVGAEKAVFVGHDWGSMVVWQQSLLNPGRVAGVVGMSVPFLPRGPMPPTQVMRNIFGDNFFYILYFQEPGVADAELGADAARTMRRMLCGLTIGPDAVQVDPEAAARMFAPGPEGFIDRMAEPAGLPDWLSQAELDHYVAEFSRTGFTGGINWYRNFDRNWEQTAHVAEAKVEAPSLFVGGAQDPVLVMIPPGIGDASLADHRGNVIVDGAGHWVQQEKPDEVNAALIGFLNDVHGGKA
jgi:pimeloyl-ACP methyl ester carboxylesterase